MKAEYELNIEDVKAYLSDFLERNPKTQRALTRWYRIFMALAVAALIVALLLVLLGGKNELPSALFAVGVAIYMALFAVIYPRLVRRTVERSTTRAYSQKPNRVLGKHRLSITPEEVTDTTDIGQSTTRWNGIDRLADTDEYLFMVVRGAAFYIVPRRAFRNEASFKQFVQSAKSYWHAATVQ